MISISDVWLVATKRVRAAKASLLIIGSESIMSELFFCKNNRNHAVPIRLLPSTKEWFFTIRYSRSAAFISKLGYKSILSKLRSFKRFNSVANRYYNI